MPASRPSSSFASSKMVEKPKGFCASGSVIDAFLRTSLGRLGLVDGVDGEGSDIGAVSADFWREDALAARLLAKLLMAMSASCRRARCSERMHSSESSGNERGDGMAGICDAMTVVRDIVSLCMMYCLTFESAIVRCRMVLSVVMLMHVCGYVCGPMQVQCRRRLC